MRHGRMLPLIVTVIALLSTMVVRPAEPGSSDTEARLDAYIAEQMEEGGIAGIGAALLVDGKVVWTKGYGFADQAQRVSFTPDTVMNIGSISKTVTGVALMGAVQEGRLSLDADINTWLPFKVTNPNFPGVPITLRQLATHTSGITDRWAVYRETYHYGGDSPESLGAFLESYFAPGGARYAKENFLKVAPGTHREYSNIGAGLAGYIVERATGDRLDTITKRVIFDPLRMRNTGWFLADMDRTRHSTLFVSQNGLTIPIPLYGGTTYPDGGVRTSVADLSRLFAALLNDGVYDGVRILDAATVAEMLRFQYTDAHKPDNVDLEDKNSGIFWQTKFNVTRMGHGGSDPGVSTEMLSSLSKDVGLVLFSNTSLSGEEAKAYVNILQALWKHAEALKAARKPPPTGIAEYVLGDCLGLKVMTSTLSDISTAVQRKREWPLA